jgi:uncharacterized membrane protein YfhO
LYKFNVNNFGFEVHAGHEGIFNIFQQYNHNWKAKINGKPAPILITNIAFMGVIIPKGFSNIELVYDPEYVITGIKIALVTLLLICMYVVIRFIIRTRLKVIN